MTMKTVTMWAMRTDDKEYPLEIDFTRCGLWDGRGVLLCETAMKQLGLSKLPLNVPTKITLTVEVPDVR